MADPIAGGPEWQLAQPELARVVVAQLVSAGAMPAVRGDAIDRIRDWIANLEADVRDRLCDAWSDAQEKQLPRAELAARIADTLTALHHGLPVTALAIYITRYVVDGLCRGSG